ncbi:PH domain-containing protein [Candidatus Saccharibacteria bacterium]|nr:PH domain-containing protein [Candidatus Saccharibacteria bacterium]
MSKDMQFDGQHEDEEVLFVFRRHPVVMRRGFIVVGICVVLGALIGMYTSRNAYTVGEFTNSFGGPVAIGLLIGLMGFFYYWIGWYYSVCIVTDQRFVQITQRGIFKQRSVNDISLGRILSVNYEISGIFETLLGFGTIIIQTLVGDFVIKNVPKPASTQAQVVTAIKESGVELDEEIPAS